LVYRLARRLRSALLRRQHGQGVVEYGLIAASLAFVGAVGFNALAGNEKTYLQNFPKNGPVPAAPGSLLHPTQISALTCSSPSWPNVVINDTITCNTPTVTDVFSNPSDLHSPGGVINYYRSASPPVVVASCTLAPVTGSTSRCPSASVAWAVTDASLADGSGRTLVAQYEVVGPTATNHLGAATNTVSFIVEPLLKFTAAAPGFGVPPPAPPHGFLNPNTDYCINYDTSLSDMPNNVEVGHPLLCTVQVTDLTHGGWYAGQPVTWKANSGSGNQDFLSCNTASGTNLAPMFTLNQCPASPSLQCTTDTNGKCSVVYRRLNTPSAKVVDAITTTSTLTISALGQSATNPAVNVHAAAPHNATVLINCGAPKTPNVTFPPPGSAALRQAIFNVTSAVNVHIPPASVTCTATAIDTDANTALDCYAGPPAGCVVKTNPDQHNAHPPVGQITWTWGGQVGPPPTCWLFQVGNFAGYQAPGQTPFASSCQNTLNFSPGGDTTLTASYSGPTHSAMPSQIPLDLDY
jgi:hypothetical protein